MVFDRLSGDTDMTYEMKLQEMYELGFETGFKIGVEIGRHIITSAI